MDSNLWLGIAGILGTLLAPVVAGKLQRSAVREDRLLETRLDAYSDLLRIAGHVKENVMTWSSLPLARLTEPSIDEIRSAMARVQVVGSREVHGLAFRLSKLSAEFYRMLVMEAQPLHARKDEEGEVDTVAAMGARIGLGKIADDLAEAVEALEAAIRREMKL